MGGTVSGTVVRTSTTRSPILEHSKYGRVADCMSSTRGVACQRPNHVTSEKARLTRLNRQERLEPERALPPEDIEHYMGRCQRPPRLLDMSGPSLLDPRGRLKEVR